MIIAFLLFWILLGAGRVLRRDPRRPARRAGQSLHTESRASQRLVTLGIVVLFAFGLAVPAIVLAFNGDHKAGVAVGGVQLNAEEQKGRELFARSCAVCHTLSAVKSVGRIGPNLDVRVGERHLHARRAQGARPERHHRRPRPRPRPDARPALPGQGSQQVADFVAAVAGH